MGEANGNGAVRNSHRSMQQHAEGPAAMLAIGTANPTGVVVPQDAFADNIFRVTNSDHLAELKEKLKRICKHMPSPSDPFLLTLNTNYPLCIKINLHVFHSFILPPFFKNVLAFFLIQIYLAVFLVCCFTHFVLYAVQITAFKISYNLDWRGY